MFQSDYLSKIAKEYENALNLIDVVFSLECCLHYQVIPLELFENHLVLGMINPKDREAIQNISPIISSLGHSFHVQSLDARTHQLVLAAYLKVGPTKSRTKNSLESSSITDSFSSPKIAPEVEISRKAVDNSATLFDIPPEAEISRKAIDNSATLFDIPPEAEISRKAIDNSATLFDIPPELIKEDVAENNLHEKPTFIISSKSTQSTSTIKENSQIFFSEPQINNLESEEANPRKSPRTKELSVNNNFEISIANLKDLPSGKLWEELLEKILRAGIGKLELQQYHNYGRITYHQNGSLKSSLEKVPLSVFEGVIREIKIMAKLPPNKLETKRKVAVQKFYNHQRILLRIEFLIGKFGEEIMIQVLSGQALKFYEHKQADKTLEQAIYLGQKLEKTLKKVRICQQSVNLGDLSNLKEIVSQIERHLQFLDYEE